MPLFYRDGDGGGAGSGSGGGEGDPGERTWESVLEGFTPQQKAAFDKHVAALKAPDEDDRKARKALEKQVADLSKAAEEGSDLKKQLDDLSAQLTEQTARADFAEEAHREGVSNVRLAYVAAKEDGLIDSKGRCNFGKLKEGYPELFAKAEAKPKGDAGKASGSDRTDGGMTSLIREAAGFRN